MNKDRPPRIVVADDDAVSLQFFIAALRGLGCTVTAAASGGEALAACAQSAPDLLLLDRRMPDLGGAPLLHELRRSGCMAPAIATSAELDAAVRADLAAAGYVDAVTKPISVARLAALLDSRFPQWSRPGSNVGSDATAAQSAQSALLEDGPALATVGGDEHTLRALRGLFANELETMLPCIATMPANELADWLHRLRASCRYCGATRLGDAAGKLELGIKAHGPHDDAQLAVFLTACTATIDALLR